MSCSPSAGSGPQLVERLAALDLIRRRQVTQRVRTQIQGKEMADGVLVPILRVARVVSRSGVKVAVARVKLEVRQFGHALPPIPRQGRQARGQAVGNLRDQGQTARTLEGLEKLRVEGN